MFLVRMAVARWPPTHPRLAAEVLLAALERPALLAAVPVLAVALVAVVPLPLLAQAAGLFREGRAAARAAAWMLQTLLWPQRPGGATARQAPVAALLAQRAVQGRQAHNRVAAAARVVAAGRLPRLRPLAREARAARAAAAAAAVRHLPTDTIRATAATAALAIAA
jgi:hypothetical protein